MSFFDDAEDRVLELYRGWTGMPAHPHSPAGGGGPGRSRQPGPQGMSATPFSTSLPHPVHPPVVGLPIQIL